MTEYLVLLRGINVGGKNKIPMATLRRHLEEAGFENVATYIQSGNVLLRSSLDVRQLQQKIEMLLPQLFELDSPVIKAAILTHDDLQAIVNNKPTGFGEQPNMYHSDAIFLMGIRATEAMAVFSPREGVDTVWPGDGVIYSQRLSSQRTKSRLNKIIGTPAYQAMTIRNWNTTTTLLRLMEQR